MTVVDLLQSIAILLLFLLIALFPVRKLQPLKDALLMFAKRLGLEARQQNARIKDLERLVAKMPQPKQADTFTVGQAVRAMNRKGMVRSIENNGRVIVVAMDDTGGHVAFSADEVQPASIKHSYGVEGKNFIG
jgi:hypothetical protein